MDDPTTIFNKKGLPYVSTSRKAERLKREAYKKEKNKIYKIIIASVVAVGVILGIIFGVMAITKNTDILPTTKDRSTSIESHVPEDIDSLFISEVNNDSWEYIRTLAKSNVSQRLDSAKYVAVAYKDGKSYLYAQGDVDEMKIEASERKLNVPNMNGVYLLDGDEDGLVEQGLSYSDSYEGQGLNSANKSFGYITTKYSDMKIDKEMGLPTYPWTWYGTFGEDAWVGYSKELKSIDFDLVKLAKWERFTKEDDAWLLASFAKSSSDDNSININLKLDQLSKLTGVKEYSASIDDIKATIKEDGLMEIVFERK